MIIATWNTRDVLARCLDSVERQKVPDGFETIVVDDASTDDTADLLRRHDGRVRVIWNERNVGYAAANNRGAAEARGEILVLLNSDTELLAPDTLARLAESAEAPGVGLVGPRILNPDGSLQPSCAAHPSVTKALIVGSGLHRLLPNGLLRRVAPEFWQHDRSIDTGWLLGAAMAIRASLFRELGGLWSYSYAEDQDLAFRVRRRGLRVRYDNRAEVLHVGNASFRQRQTDVERAALVAHAELRFLQVHYPRARGAAIRGLVGTGYAVRAVVHARLGHRARAAIYRVMAGTYAASQRTDH